MKLMAFAISTICFWAIFSSCTLRFGSIDSPRRARTAAAFSFIFLKLMRPERPRGSRRRKMFCATVSSGRGFSSWWIIEMPSCCVSSGVAPWRIAFPLYTMLPASTG